MNQKLHWSETTNYTQNLLTTNNKHLTDYNMKFTFRTVCFSAIFVATIGLLVMYSGNNSAATSALALSNIEALTADEVGMTYTCYKSITEKEGCQVRYCQTCKFTPGTDSWYSFASECTYR